MSRLRTRDWALVRIIQGATKAAVHVDRKKEGNRRACRDRRDHGEEEQEG